VIGTAWSVIRPVLTTIIFTVIFGRVAKMETPGNIPYPLMVFAGILPWQFFSNALSEASSSLVSNTNLISKVYFPRLIVPASSVITSLVDFAISFVIFVLMMIYYQHMPPLQVLFLPFLIIMAFLSVFGLGLLITAMNVKYRDFRYIIPFIVQFGLYISPVGFSSVNIPDKYRLLYSLNPMAGVIDGFRWALLNESIYWPGFLVSVGVILIFLFIGISYFRRTEKSFADNI
jgi:lipopolysaccharide transport system permease protein